MLELIARESSPVPGTIPWSGPGTKVLTLGTEDYGYFGRVPDSVLGMGSKLAALLPSNKRDFTDTPATNMWGKFIRKGKVLYVPQFPIGRTMFAWNFDTKVYYNALLPSSEIPRFPMIGKTAYTMNQTFTTSDGSTVFARNLLDQDGVKFIQYTGNDPVKSGEVLDLIYRPYFPASEYANAWKLPLSDFEPAYAGRNPEVFCQHPSHDSNQMITVVISAANGSRGRYLIGGSSKECLWLPILQFVPPDEVPNLPT